MSSFFLAGRPLRARLAVTCIFAAAAVAVASCGSRTGLFGETSSIGPGGVDASTPVDGGLDGQVPCTSGRFSFELATAQLMFVIDRSGSMAFSLDGQQPGPNGNLPPGVPSRWQTLRDALFQTILPFDNALSMGAKFY